MIKISNLRVFKAGDLVRVIEPRACGGLPLGALGLVLERESSVVSVAQQRYTVMWIHNNEVMPGFPMKESVTYGYGLEVLSAAG